jgi:hypothetical protein
MPLMVLAFFDGRGVASAAEITAPNYVKSVGEMRITISQKGVFRRPVIVVGRWALKIARDWQGCDCNKYEAKLYRSVSDKRRMMLCPVLWISPWGLLLVMAAAEPTTTMMTIEDYGDLCDEWDYLPGEDGCPFEPKPSDWGIYRGRWLRSIIQHLRGESAGSCWQLFLHREGEGTCHLFPNCGVCAFDPPIAPRRTLGASSPSLGALL